MATRVGQEGGGLAVRVPPHLLFGEHIIELMKDEPFKERFHERSQNTILLASTQAVYKGPHSTVQGAVSHSHTLE